MMAARSLPATETTRDRGSAAFMRSPKVCALRYWADTVVFVDEDPGTLGSSAQYTFLSGRLSD